MWRYKKKPKKPLYILDRELNKHTEKKQEMWERAEMSAEKLVIAVGVASVLISVNNKDKLIPPLVPVY